MVRGLMRVAGVVVPPATERGAGWYDTGDIVTIDIGVHYGGFHTDSAWSYPVGTIAPETQRLMDATEAYLAGGGRVMYLGGNGYYWVTGTRSDEPACIEVRKLDSGSRAWQAEPYADLNKASRYTDRAILGYPSEVDNKSSRLRVRQPANIYDP